MRATWSSFCFAMLIFFVASDGFGAIYKYTTEEGAPGFADDLYSIPEKCRATAVLIEDNPAPVQTRKEMPPARDEVKSESTPVHVAQTARGMESGAGARMTFTFRLLITFAAVCVYFLLRWAVSRVGDFPRKDRVLPAAYFMLTAVLWVYIVAAHGRDVTGLYTTASTKIEETKRKSAERGKKAAEAIKAMNEFMAGIDKAPGSIQKHDEDPP